MNMTTKSTSRLSLPLLCALFAISALPSLAADTYWNGSVDDKWGTPGNWGDGLPTASVYAHFGSPYYTPLTLTVDDIFDVYAFSISGSRMADLTFIGNGALEIYRTSEIVVTNGGVCRLTFDVNVTNASSHAQTILGDNTFLKDLYIGGGYDFYIGASDGRAANVSLEGNADMTCKNLTVNPGSSFTLSDNVQVNLARQFTIQPGGSATISGNAQVSVADGYDFVVNPGATLSVSGNPLIKFRRMFLPFSREEGVDDEWTMNGGTFRAVNGDNTNYRLELPYTNAVKTLSGSGTFQLYRFYVSNSSNLTVRLNGPNAYLRQFAGGHNTAFQIGNGSTVGTWGGDLAITSLARVTIDGEVVVDTTDYEDGTTARMISLGALRDCSGTITVKGVGTCKLSSPEQPNLGLVGNDGSTISFTSAYAIGDIVLNDSAKLDVVDYVGHKTEEATRIGKSLTMNGDSSLDVGRYVILSGDTVLSGNATAVIRHKSSGDADPIFTCANLSLSDNASLVVTGQISAATLSISGRSHLAFAAGTVFASGSSFEGDDWTMEIIIPSGYEPGVHPVVTGVGALSDITDHITLVGETSGWSLRTIGDDLVLYSDAPPSGIEWIGKSTTSDNWSDDTNWNDHNVPTADDIVAFGGLDRPTPYKDTEGSVSGLVFRASAGPFVLSGAGDLVLTADCGGRSTAKESNAAIVSHSAYDQTIASAVNFGNRHVGLFSDGGGALKLTGGFTATDPSNPWKYFVVCGDVRIGGECSVGILSLKKSTTATPTCLRVLSGGNFTILNQYYRGIVEDSRYIGRIVVEEGGTMVIRKGDCAFWEGELENVIDGTLTIKGSGSENGRLVGGPEEQYYSGKGTIYADSARSGRKPAVADHYINIGGTLRLYMNGDWYTATYRWDDGEKVMQDPNYPTRFRMKDGTTLGATADWTYGPAPDASDVIAVTNTPADRASIMVGTVTVDTQNPTNDTAYTITFVDPLDASAANVVKVGAGSLVFNPTNGCPSQVSNLTVNAGTVLFKGDSSPTVGGVVANAGTVRFDVGPALGDMTISNGATASFAAAPTLSGSLTIASTDANFCVDGVADTAAWELLATAADIVGPNSETKWKTANGMRRFKIVSEVAGKVLYGAKASGFAVIVR